jgi:hypothetical protein
MAKMTFGYRGERRQSSRDGTVNALAIRPGSKSHVSGGVPVS